MRLKNATGLYGPLFAAALAAAAGGCATPIDDPPAEYKNAPTIKAIYATDFANAYNNDFLILGWTPSDVLIYSASEPDKTGATPASYGAFRIEFSQPLDATTIAANSDIAAVNATPFASFCSTVSGGSPITLVDVDDATIGTVPSSICYDPSSALGSYPNIVLVPGAQGTTKVGATPFTCNSFTNEDGSSDGAASNVFKPKHKYAIKFDATRVKGGPSGKALTLDSAWSGNSFTFTTDDFSLMAVGYQDQNTGYFTWLDKPNKGYMKDLAALGAANFVIPPDDTPLFFIFSSKVDSAPDASVARADGTSNDGGCGDWGENDSRVYYCAAGLYWESNGTYKITLPTTTKGATGTALATAATYTIKSGTASPRVRVVSPGDATVANSIKTTDIFLQVQEPVDSATLAGVTLKQGSTSVPGSAAIVDGTNHQVIDFTITLPTGTYLTPNTTYTISATGLKVASGTPNKGAAIADFTSTFNTATFRSSNIYKSLSSTSTANQLDRTIGQNPTVLRSGSFNVRFTNVPTAGTVSPSSVILGEIGSDGAFTAIDSSKYTVAVNGATLTQYVIKVTDATYPLKWNQKYGVKFLQTITDLASGQKLTAEGCTSTDCTEVRSFSTAKFEPSISVTDTVKGTFAVTFNVAAVDLASVNDYVNTAYKLYPQDATTKALGTPIAMTCSLYATNTTTCTTTTPLKPNSKYIASATFLQTVTAGQSGPAKVASTVSGFPADTGAGSTFYGTATAEFTTDCP